MFGWLAFRSRVTGVYLSIITQAMTFALMLAFFRNDMGFGGNNGLTDFKDILGFDVQDGGTRVALFLASGLAVLGGYLLAARIVRSKLGQVLVAVRDAELRTRFWAIGWSITNFSCGPCQRRWPGSPGRFTCRRWGIINPSEFSPANSIEAVIWVAVGGRGPWSAR